MGGFQFIVSGLESIDEDMKELETKLKNDIAQAMPQVGQVMKDTLKEHIESDVYAAYDPKAYPRRSEFPQFGTALNNIDATTVVETGSDMVALEYSPSGEHTGTRRDLLPPYNKNSSKPIIENPASGDQLIRRIESGDGYDFGFAMERPFFQNFTEEMIEGGKATETLINAINLIDPDAGAEMDGDGAVRDGTEWDG